MGSSLPFKAILFFGLDFERMMDASDVQYNVVTYRCCRRNINECSS